MLSNLYHPYTEKSKCLHSSKHSHACSLSPTFSTPKKLFCSLKSSGICQPQTELIALNHSRSLKVSGRGDVIIGVAEVAWESSEILSLTSPSLQRSYPIRLINHPISLDFVNTGIDFGRTLWAWRCSLRGPDVVSCVSPRVCVCIGENSAKPGFGIVRGGSEEDGWQG